MIGIKDTYFLGVDVGTQGTKAVMIDGWDGGVVAESRDEYPIYEKQDGTREQNPEDWKRAVFKTVGEIISRLDNAEKIKVKGIGISGQQHGLVPLDKDGRVIRKAKLWNDTSTVKQCDEIINRIGGVGRAIELTGNNILPGYTAPKVLWLKENEPENYKKLATMLLPHDYINFILTGEKKTEPGDASGTAYFNVREKRWAVKILEAIDSERDLTDCLPELIKNEEPAGYVRPNVLEEFGLPADHKIIVSSGGGDNMMGAIGTGNTRQGIITMSLGTSGTVYAYSSVPVIDEAGEFAAFCDSTGGWLPLACTMNVTVATEMMKKLFEMDNRLLEEAVNSSSPGAGGLILLPYFNGERTPNIPFGTGVFFGINEFTLTRENMARSAMEGVTLGLRYGLECMMREGIKPEEIRLTGGGSKSGVWRQIVADIFNTRAVGMVIDEAAGVGAAIQAMWCYLNSEGEDVKISDITDRFIKVNEQTMVTPRKEYTGLYDEMYRLQTELSSTLYRTFEAHRRLLVEKFGR